MLFCPNEHSFTSYRPWLKFFDNPCDPCIKCGESFDLILEIDRQEKKWLHFFLFERIKMFSTILEKLVLTCDLFPDQCPWLIVRHKSGHQYRRHSVKTLLWQNVKVDTIVCMWHLTRFDQKWYHQQRVGTKMEMRRFFCSNDKLRWKPVCQPFFVLSLFKNKVYWED